jgi:D-3-phosphoglycerate dehydrogenase
MLGRLYAQFAPNLDGLTLEVAGELASHDTHALIAATLGGLLADTEERVNVVNAPALAKARGINLVERKVADAGRHASLLTLSGSAVVGGTVANGEPRLVRLQEHWLDMAPSGSMLITHHQDMPGTVGRVGILLGEADVNISAMYLARTDPRADAYMILALDDAPDDAVADRIRSMEAMLDLWLIRLD